MKQIIFSTLSIIGMFFFISCERHTWEDSAEGKKDGTKRLFPKPSKGNHDAHQGHDHDAHSKKAGDGDSHKNHDHGSAKKEESGHAQPAH